MDQTARAEAHLESWENVYADILARLQDICTKNEIDIWLAGHTALSAFRGDGLVCGDVAVFVRASDALRLEEALRTEAGETLGVESLLSNDRFPGFDFRVFDPRTTDCDTSDFFRYDNNCMHVTVRMLSRPDAKNGKAAGFIDKLSRKLLGPSEQYRRRLRSQAGSGSGHILQAGKCSFDSGIFKERQPIALYGGIYYIPSDHNSFFEAQFGPGWQYMKYPVSGSGERHFISAARSWKEWRPLIPQEDIRSYESDLKEFRKENAAHRGAQRVISRVHDKAAQSYDRIQMYRVLAGRKDELRGLLRTGRYDELEKDIEDYLSKLKEYTDKGLDLYIDDEITEIACGLLEHRGCRRFADQIRQLIPNERPEICLTDHHGRELERLPERSAADKDAEGSGNDSLSVTQLRLLDLMKRVDVFLRENEIEYFLFGGSLLGAVRHDGFIPWDDDMDIVMTRDNYYRLVGLSDDLPWDDIAFDCYERNPQFRKPFGMFTLLTDTRFVDDRIYFGGAGMGTGIDVFVMDNVPRDHLREYLRDSLLYQEIQTDATLICADILEYRDEYFKCKEREASAGKAAETARLISELEKYGPKKPDDLQVVRLWSKKPRIYEPGMMEAPVLHSFEDTQFPIPKRAVECLEMQYGPDWNVIPEGADRGIHAFRIDRDLSAINYYRLIDRDTDWDRVFKALDERKQSRVRSLDKRLKLDAFRKELMIYFAYD